MKRQLLTTMGVAALGMVSYAATFMRVKTADGSIVRYAVEDVIEVDFEDEYVIPSDTVPVSNHPYVDLGLPSGTLWATYNVGATKPEEYGDYFAWGETEPKDVYDWSTYKYAKASGAYDLDSITKYNMSGDYGIIDSLSVLLPEDDAATANRGKEWRMPTEEEQIELVEECYWVWTNGYNGSNVSGYIVYKVKSIDDKGRVEYPGGDYQSEIKYSVSSDAHVFLPAAGVRSDGELDGVGYYVDYWSSTLDVGSDSYARGSYFYIYGLDWHSYGMHVRDDGFPVRAVRVQKAERKMYVVKFYTSDSILIESQEVVEGASAKEIQAPEKNGYEFVGWSSSFDKVTSDLSVYALYKQIVPYVDLGLPSGTLWATYNIGATKPEEYGDYFAWGETKPKNVYDSSTYKWWDDNFDKYDTYFSKYYNHESVLPEDDAATANWGKKWRMPTNEEQRELSKYCYKVWTDDYNGTNVRGVIFYKAKNSWDIGKGGLQAPSAEYSVSSDAHIFLPAAGGIKGDELNGVGDFGGYLSSTLYSGLNSAYVLRLNFDEKELNCNDNGPDYSRTLGYPVRAVRAK